MLSDDDVVFTVEALQAFLHRPASKRASYQQRTRRFRPDGDRRPTPATSSWPPVISEKSYGLIEDNVYTFVVHPDSNKTADQDRDREDLRGQGRSVNTAQPQGKRKRTRSGYGKRKSTKRAIVTLAPGSKPIDLFGAPA